MSAEDSTTQSVVGASPVYVMSAQEQAFVEGVVGPRIRLEVSEIRRVMELDINKAFSDVRTELTSEVSKLRELLKTQATTLRGELLTRMDDKMTTFSSTFSLSPRSEPPLLHDVSFSGDSQHLDSFLYSIYDALAAHASAFSDDGRRVKWIARHFKPVGSPAADWWLSLVAENASLFNEQMPEGKTAAQPFRLTSLLTVDSFLNELVTSFADPFAAQKALKTLQYFSMGKLGVQQFNVKFNSLSYRVKGLSEPILMDYYQRALTDKVR